MSRCAKKFSVAKFSFSIDHILNVAGKKPNFENFAEEIPEERNFEWLNCTRYRPPKLPRQRKKEGIRRRKSNRNPRIPFSSSQVAFLEAKFLRTPYLSSGDVTHLASYLKLSEARVKIWFQNRRAREKRDKELKYREAENSRTSKTRTVEESNDPRRTELEEPASENFFRFPGHQNGPALAHWSLRQWDAPLDLSERQSGRRSEAKSFGAESPDPSMMNPTQTQDLDQIEDASGSTKTWI